MKAHFVKVSWLPLPRRFVAITIAPFIFHKVPLSEALKRHELVHIEQVNRLGWVRFYVTYLWYSIKYGYDKNPFEIEAKNRE